MTHRGAISRDHSLRERPSEIARPDPDQQPRRRRGRPAGRRAPPTISAQMRSETIQKVQAWMETHGAGLTRPDAIAKLIDVALELYHSVPSVQPRFSQQTRSQAAPANAAEAARQRAIELAKRARSGQIASLSDFLPAPPPAKDMTILVAPRESSSSKRI